MKITNPIQIRIQKQDLTRTHIQFTTKIWQEQELRGRKKIIPLTRLTTIRETHDWNNKPCY
jgi:hypothetical protein